MYHAKNSIKSFSYAYEYDICFLFVKEMLIYEFSYPPKLMCKEFGQNQNCAGIIFKLAVTNSFRQFESICIHTLDTGK